MKRPSIAATAPRHARGSGRLVVLALSVVVGAALVEWALRRRSEAPASVLLDQRAQLDLLLEGGASALESEAAPTVARDPNAPLFRRELDLPTARVFFPAVDSNRYTHERRLFLTPRPRISMWFPFPEHPRGGWQLETNSLGFRGRREPAEQPPDLRILVVGASNVEGMCAESETASAVLEQLLRAAHSERSVEVLNAGVGSVGMLNYVAALEQRLSLEPDVFVLVAHGGTDFSNSLPLERYLRGQPNWDEPALSCAGLLADDDPFVRGLAGIELGQLAHFAVHPEDVDHSARITAEVTRELHRLCAQNDITWIAAYAPPPLAGQPRWTARERERALSRLPIDEASLAISDALADRWLALLDELAIESIDLRPRWREAQERYYWRTDPHLDPAGQRALAQALFEALEAE